MVISANGAGSSPDPEHFIKISPLSELLPDY